MYVNMGSLLSESSSLRAGARTNNTPECMFEHVLSQIGYRHNMHYYNRPLFVAAAAARDTQLRRLQLNGVCV